MIHAEKMRSATEYAQIAIAKETSKLARDPVTIELARERFVFRAGSLIEYVDQDVYRREMDTATKAAA